MRVEGFVVPSALSLPQTVPTRRPPVSPPNTFRGRYVHIMLYICLFCTFFMKMLCFKLFFHGWTSSDQGHSRQCPPLKPSTPFPSFLCVFGLFSNGRREKLGSHSTRSFYCDELGCFLKLYTIKWRSYYFLKDVSVYVDWRRPLITWARLTLPFLQFKATKTKKVCKLAG